MAREKKTSGGIRWRLWLGAAAFLLIAASTALAAVKVRQHILTDSTYLFSHDNKDALTIQGMVYAPRAKVAHVFAGDFGHSVLSIPLTNAAAGFSPSIGWRMPPWRVSGPTA